MGGIKKWVGSILERESEIEAMGSWFWSSDCVWDSGFSGVRGLESIFSGCWEGGREGEMNERGEDEYDDKPLSVCFFSFISVWLFGLVSVWCMTEALSCT